MTVAAPSPEPVDRLTIPSPASAPRYRMVAAFALYYLIPLWIAWFVYDFSTDGLLSEIAEATGALAIPALIATVVRVRGKRKSNVPFYIAVGFAAFGIISGNQYRIKETIDVSAFQREMTGATPEDFRDRLAHSQTRFGQTIYSVIQSSENSGAKLSQVMTTLDDSSTSDILTKETLLDREKRSHAEQILKQKMEFAQATFPQIGVLYDDVRKNMVTTLADAPDNMKRSFLIGFDETRPEKEKLLKAYVANHEDLYKHVLTMLTILDANDGRFTLRPDGKVIFGENAPIAPYNQETVDLQRDAANIQQIQARMAAIQSAGIKKMIPAQ